MQRTLMHPALPPHASPQPPRVLRALRARAPLALLGAALAALACGVEPAPPPPAPPAAAASAVTVADAVPAAALFACRRDNAIQGYTVPANVDRVLVKLYGASGSDNESYSADGGLGGVLTAVFPAYPGMQLGVRAGCAGTGRAPGVGYSNGGIGGDNSNHGDIYARGGGGGGSTGVPSRSSPPTWRAPAPRPPRCPRCRPRCPAPRRRSARSPASVRRRCPSRRR